MLLPIDNLAMANPIRGLFPVPPPHLIRHQGPPQSWRPILVVLVPVALPRAPIIGGFFFCSRSEQLYTVLPVSAPCYIAHPVSVLRTAILVFAGRTWLTLDVRLGVSSVIDPCLPFLIATHDLFGPLLAFFLQASPRTFSFLFKILKLHSICTSIYGYVVAIGLGTATDIVDPGSRVEEGCR